MFLLICEKYQNLMSWPIWFSEGLIVINKFTYQFVFGYIVIDVVNINFQLLHRRFIGLDKQIFSVKFSIFSNPSVCTYVLGFF